jgi:hypothetical protein
MDDFLEQILIAMVGVVGFIAYLLYWIYTLGWLDHLMGPFNRAIF